MVRASITWLFAALVFFSSVFSIAAFAVTATPSTSTDGSLTVSWGNNYNSSNFRLWESRNGASPSVAFTGNATQRTLTGRSSGTYTYTVEEWFCPITCLWLAHSGSATVTVSVVPAPSTPGAISAPSTANTGSYAVSWGASSGTLTAYELQQRANGGSWSTVYTGTSRSRSYTQSQNNYYDYRVRACNQTSCSSYTSNKRVTIPLASISLSTNPASLSRSDNAFTLSWGSVMTSSCSWNAGSISGTSGSKSFRLYSGWTQIPMSSQWIRETRMTCNVIGGGTVVKDFAILANGLQPKPSVSVNWNSGTGYVGESSTLSWSSSEADSCTLDSGGVSTSGSRGYIYSSTGTKTKSVTCSNEQGSTTASKSISVVYRAPGLPGSISGPSTASNGSYTISWNPASGTVTQYQLQERRNGGSWSAVYTGTSRSHPYTKTQNNYYDYRVRACNNGACSSYTSNKRVTIPAASITISTNPTVLNRSDSSFILSWSSVMTSSCSWNAGSISGTSGSKSFHVYDGWTEIISTSQWARNTQMTCNVIGGGSVSKSLTLVANGIQPKPSVTVNWHSGTGYVGESSTLNWSTSEADSCTLDGGSVGTSGSSSFTYTSTGTKTKSVICTNEMGSTTKSKSISVVYRAPGIPSSLSAPSTDSDGSYTVSWGTASGTLTEYQLQERPNGGSWSTVYTGTSRSRSYSKTQNTYYDYRVRACNNGACSGYTSSKRVTMPPASVSASALPATLTYGTSDITLSWSSVMVSSCSWTGVSAFGTSGPHQTVLTQWVHNASSNRWEVPLSISCNIIGGGTVTDNLTVIATHREPVPIVSATWDTSAIPMGQAATFSWTSDTADSCQIDGIDVDLNGARPYSFGSAQTHSKTIVCSNLGGSANASASIAVEGISVNFPSAVDPTDDLPASGETYYGNLVGNFNVSGGGAATYSVPIAVPPGIRGMQPSLSVAYNSDRSNGIAGWGWSISGLSRIHRCPASQLRDGYTSGTLDGDSYKYCLDGQRLVEVATNEYRTERESDRRITKDTTGFTVYLRNGRKLFYGKTSDARRASKDSQSYVDWHLNQVEDLVGNSMTYHYEKDASIGVHRIDYVAYTHNSEGGLNHRVDFVYEAREDVMSGYWSGIQYLHDKRLQTVDVTADGALVRRYNLAYQGYNDTANADPAKISRLSSIAECFDLTSTICKDPVEFEWTSRKADDFGFTETKLVNANHEDFDDSWLMDFDGDGVREVLYDDVPNQMHWTRNFYVVEQGEVPTSGADQLKGAFADLDGYIKVLATVDINHDGLDDIVYLNTPVEAVENQELWVAYSNGISFDTPEVFTTIAGPNVFHLQFRDFNGDGLVDIYRIPNPSYSSAEGYGYEEPANRYQRIEVSLNQGNGQFSGFLERGIMYGGDPTTRRLSDMNGDGLLDVVMCDYIQYEWHYRHQDDSYCRFLVYLNNGDDGNGNISFADRVTWEGVEVSAISWSQRNNADATHPPEEQMLQLADMNGDRLPDAVWMAKDDVQVAINRGDSFAPLEVWLDQSVTPEYGLYPTMSLVDLNTDGYPDFVFNTDGGDCRGGGCSGGHVRVAYNLSGQGFSEPIDTNAYVWGFFGEDLNDDGVNDINGQKDVISLSGSLGIPLGTQFYENKLNRHRITGFTAGGSDISLSYSPLNASDVHTKTSGNLSFSGTTAVDYIGGENTFYYENNGEKVVASFASTAVATRYLVENVDIDDGIGGTNNTEYHYTGFLRHRGGWGGLGFEQVQSTSTIGATGQQTRTVSEYIQEVGDNYKVAGLLKTRTQYADNADGNLQEISRTQNHWHVQTMVDDTDGYTSPHYRVIGDASHSESQDLNGADIANSSRYTLSYDAAAPTACDTTDISDFVSVSTAQHAGIDAYGNVHQNVSLTCDGTSTFTSATKTQYENRTTGDQWLLGLVTNTQITSTSPDESGALQSLTREQSNTYEANSGLPHTQIREPQNSDLSRTTTIASYDAYGTPTNITESWNNGNGLDIEGNARSSTMSVTYQSDGSRTITATNAAGHSTTSIVDGKFGQVRSFTDANNLTTTTTFDVLGRIDTITAPDGSTVVNSYRVCDGCEAPSPQARSYVHSKASGASAQRSYFDAYGRQVGQRMIGLTGIPSYTQIDYDAAGRVASASEPFFIGEDRYNTTYEYDSLGRTTLVTAPNDGETETRYNGLEITVINALEQQRKQTQNGIGQNIKTTDHYDTSIEYAYDPFGNLEQTEVIIAGETSGVVTTMGYDLLGRQSYLDDPSAGRIDYTYNGLDLMHTSTDAKNQRTEFSYDVLGRQITRVDNAGASGVASRTHEWFYDTPNSGEGRLDSVEGFDTDGVAYSENYDYNAYGLPTIVETTIQGETYETQTYYDDLNRPVGIAYPTGFTVVNHYNNYGYRHQVSNGMDESTLWTATEADARGNITNSEHGNGVETVREYNADTGFVNSIFAEKGSNNLLVQNQDFTYDVLGNLTFREDQRVQMVQAFCYDKLNRLTAARRDECSNDDNDITYDELGNIQTRAMESGTQSYVYDVTNPYKLMSTNMAGSYGYDNNGNITSGDGRTIEYSSFDKPTRMTKDGNTVEITYSADQTRIKRIDSGDAGEVTTFYVAGVYEIRREGNEIQHLHQIGDIALRIREEECHMVDIFDGNGDVIGQEEQCHITKQETSYLHHDHIGSLVAKSNQAGDGVEFSASDPWGLRQDESWLGSILGTDYVPTDTREGFTGHEHMDGVGLIHMNGRVYDPNVGRFLSPDPIIQAPSATQSFNRYSYVWNNPLSMTDPSGYECGGQGTNSGGSCADEVVIVEGGSGGGSPFVTTVAPGDVNIDFSLGSLGFDPGVDAAGLATTDTDNPANQDQSDDEEEQEEEEVYVYAKKGGGQCAGPCRSYTMSSDGWPVSAYAMNSVRMDGRNLVPAGLAIGGLLLAEMGAYAVILEFLAFGCTECPVFTLRFGVSGEKVTLATKGMGTVLAKSPKATSFLSPKALRQHWKKHVQKGNEWGVAMTEAQYLARAKKFLSGAPGKHTLQYQRFNGQTVRFSTRTGEYGVVGADGTISTLFRPAMSKRGGDGLSYFLNDRMKNVGY